MATVLFAWELGGGLGHMLQMLPLAAGLAGRNHRVFVALRHLGDRAAKVFARSPVYLLQAPYKAGGPVVFPRPANFAQVLENVGFGTDGDLQALFGGWRNLCHLIKPNLIIFDHSPTALLASRGLPVRRILIGTGFFYPPDRSPQPPFSTRAAKADPTHLLESEERVVSRANKLLRRGKLPVLDSLFRLYGNADENFLTTFPDLDHYGARPHLRYWGPVNGSGGNPPKWPQGSGKRVYAYLKNFPALPDLLDALNERGNPTLVFVDGIRQGVRQRHQSASLRFETERLDLSAVGRECDLAILNANHGTLSELLLAGRPVLQLPITLEQRLLADAVCRLGAGELAPAGPGNADEIAQKLDLMLTDEGSSYTAAARQFAEQHADFDPQHQRREMLERAEALLGATSSLPAHSFAINTITAPGAWM